MAPVWFRKGGAMTFVLHPRLAADAVPAGDLPLCRVLVMNDRRFPWAILVPRRPDIREIHELQSADRQQLLEESCWLGKWMMQTFPGDKLNVAALGNLVPQLHLHHVVRRVDDVCWPGPIWGCGAPEPMNDEAWDSYLHQFREAISRMPGDLGPLAD
jgi:diadenosine tetraphosphate (Ap4A) HIT family hydrolase